MVNHNNFAALQAAQRARRFNPALHTGRQSGTPLPLAEEERARQLSLELPSLVLQAILVPGEKTPDGEMVVAVAPAWMRILDIVLEKPDAVYELGWREWEEIVAGAYTADGWEVTLTPRSNDKGRDVIAVRRGFGSIKIIEQVKAYKPGHLVTANDVRALVGVLTLESNVSKGIVTTTSAFAPGIGDDPDLRRLMPYRLELKAKDELLEWLKSVPRDRWR